MPRDIVHFTVRKGKLRARVPFFVVQSLAADFLLVTSSNGHHVETVLRRLRKVVFHQSPAVAINGHRALNRSKPVPLPGI